MSVHHDPGAEPDVDQDGQEVGEQDGPQGWLHHEVGEVLELLALEVLVHLSCHVLDQVDQVQLVLVQSVLPHIDLEPVFLRPRDDMRPGHVASGVDTQSENELVLVSTLEVVFLCQPSLQGGFRSEHQEKHLHLLHCAELGVPEAQSCISLVSVAYCSKHGPLIQAADRRVLVESPNCRINLLEVEHARGRLNAILIRVLGGDRNECDVVPVPIGDVLVTVDQVVVSIEVDESSLSPPSCKPLELGR